MTVILCYETNSNEMFTVKKDAYWSIKYQTKFNLPCITWMSFGKKIDKLPSFRTMSCFVIYKHIWIESLDSNVSFIHENFDCYPDWYPDDSEIEIDIGNFKKYFIN